MPEHPRRRRAARWLGPPSLAVLALCAAAPVLQHWRGGLTSVGVIVAAAVPAILVVGLLAAVIAPWHRRPLRIVLAAVLLAGQAPLLDHLADDPGGPAADAVELRVTALNTKWLGPGEDEVAALAEHADVLVLNEFPPSQVDAVTARLGEQWQLASADRDDYIRADNVVWVRRTWTVAARTPVPEAMPAASRLTLVRDGTRVTLVGTRLQNPAFGAADLWGQGLDALATTADASTDPVVVLGDLNSPPSAVAFRDALGRGRLADCPAQLGAGFPGTWGPGDDLAVAPVPIDHVLVGGPTGRRARCTAFATVRAPGTDHRAVRATVALPR